jgi:uncharacterized protein
MPDIFLQRIRIYPIKACAGTDVLQAILDKRGLHYDRRWMLINEHNMNLHQYDYPRLATIVVALDNDSLVVQAPGMEQLYIPQQPQHSTPMIVRWGQGTCEALHVSDEADRWFQDYLHTSCRLVFMPDSVQHYAEKWDESSHDLAGFTTIQYHLINESSLEDLNQRLTTPVSLERFRPNLVITGVPAFEEDRWRTIQIGQQVFQVVKPCDRCAIITVDPGREVMTGKEPLTTLARYRTFNHQVLFGQYLRAEGKGVLHVGDKIQVIGQGDDIISSIPNNLPSSPMEDGQN